jgi:hypothetical protein
MPDSVVAADVNGDGRPDLISANFDGDNTEVGNLSVLTNNGSGRFFLALTLRTGNAANNYPIRVAAVDVNGDGRLDLTCVNIAANTVAVLTNTSIFPPPTSTPPLSINFRGNRVRVSWPSASAGWSLQQNMDLTTSHWGPSGYNGYNISDDLTNKSLTIPAQPINLFFRLLHP